MLLIGSLPLVLINGNGEKVLRTSLQRAFSSLEGIPVVDSDTPGTKR